MIDLSISQLDAMTIHFVGNPQADESLIISNSLVDLNSETLKSILYHYFLSDFQSPEHYSFFPGSDQLSWSLIHQLAAEVFSDPTTLLSASREIVQRLFDVSRSANIKSGELSVVYFDQINFKDELTDALGIFKTETKENFLKFMQQNETYHVSYDNGIPLDKLDKGCLIFNTHQSDGYRVFITDRSSKGGEAVFWKDDFLQLQECTNDYSLTKNLLSMTRSFVNHQLQEDFEVEKVDQIDLLNKTMHYFKENDSFEQEDFADQVFPDAQVANKFKDFQKECSRDLNIPIAQTFEISYPAVKKQSRVFRSVIKLDKNFHIYVHGDRQRIEKGVDDQGQKYYKLIYDLES